MKAEHTEQSEYYGIISAIVRGCAFTSFLELGIGPGVLCPRLRRDCPKLDRILGVDIQNGYAPPPGVTYLRELSTDQFFRENREKETPERFDCIFIDALHEHAQATRDFVNARRVLTEDGLIFLHDTYPPNPESVSPQVCGDVFRTYLALAERTDLEVVNLPLFNGLCIVRPLGSDEQNQRLRLLTLGSS